MTEKKPTRIQIANREKISRAALEVFAREGFSGATVDAIAEAAGMSKPNLLYYFPGKEAIYREVLERLLEDWLAPLHALRADGDPAEEIAAYLDRKIEMARAYPTESRLFAGEIMRGAPVIGDVLAGDLKVLVDEKSAVIETWVEEGRLAPCDPRHLIFAIWATTQHYADFDTQVRAVLGKDDKGRYADAAAFLRGLFLNGLLPRDAAPD